jgi:hypothetical protein
MYRYSEIAVVRASRCTELTIWHAEMTYHYIQSFSKTSLFLTRVLEGTFQNSKSECSVMPRYCQRRLQDVLNWLSDMPKQHYITYTHFPKEVYYRVLEGKFQNSKSECAVMLGYFWRRLPDVLNWLLDMLK